MKGVIRRLYENDGYNRRMLAFTAHRGDYAFWWQCEDAVELLWVINKVCIWKRGMATRDAYHAAVDAADREVLEGYDLDLRAVDELPNNKTRTQALRKAAKAVRRQVPWSLVRDALWEYGNLIQE